MPEFKAHFKSVQPDLGGSLPGQLIFGIPGEAGGYYTIQITQPDKHTMRLTFIPSKQNMEQIAPVDIILPKGPEGDPAQIDMEKIRQFVIDYLTANPPQVVESDPTVPSWAKQPEKPSYSKSEVGLGNVDNVRQYSASNPPPYPVVSVNGKTGKVQLGAADVGARPSSWMPTAQEVGALPDTYVPPNQTAAQVGADPAGTAAAAVSAHNTSTDSHWDLRLELKAINDRLTAFFDSDNQTLDELSEIVAYITSNKALIDSITTSKVSVADIINNLTTNVANKPLSAAQGVVLKGLIDAVSNSLSNYQPKGDYALRSELPTVPTKVSQLQNDKGYLTEHQDISGKLDADKLPEAVNTALAQAKESGEFDGEDGQRGTGLLAVTTAPASYTTAVGGITPKYRMAISTIKTQAGVTEVLLGDIIRYSYYQYPIAYLDASYAYFTTRISVRGATGTDGKDYSFDPTVYGLPVLYLTGDTTGMTKDNPVTLSYLYGDLSGSCTLKWQGSSSLAYEKKNYTIKLDTAAEIVEGWGAQTKYCLKANFIDHSHARNIVSAKLWGQIVASRSPANSTLAACPNYGAVDGFPIVIVLNNEFHGLYTWNIPKDAWLFNMDGTGKQAILCADVPNNEGAVGFHVLADLQNDFELEYSSDDASDWVLESLNTLIAEVKDSDGTNLDKIGKYLDWDSAIDWYIFTVLITGLDNTKKNYILATYDGTKWFYSAYDMDSTFGLFWDGSSFEPADRRPTFATRGSIYSDRLMHLIWAYKRDELRARYAELRNSCCSESNLYVLFTNFCAAIPSPVFVEDVKRWPSIPYSSVNNVHQILNNYRLRVMYADEWIKDTTGELNKPGQEAAYTNLVPTSTDTDGSIFNGTGYQDGMRFSSSGALKEQDGGTATGFMPFTKADTVYVGGVKFGGTWADTDVNGAYTGAGGYCYIALYNSSKTMLKVMSYNNYFEGTTNGLSITHIGNTTETKLTKIELSGFTGGEVAYVRISAMGNGADMIVTKNEEIT